VKKLLFVSEIMDWINYMDLEALNLQIADLK
jgi:hypothetical protein